MTSLSPACLRPLFAALVIALLVAACQPAGGEGSAEARSEHPAATLDNAAEAYRLGREMWQTRQRANLLGSVPYFERAIELDPRYALGWAGLADSLALIGLYSITPPGEAMPGAAEAARRAIELDPELANAHASLGLVRYLWEWDWSGAEESFRRSLDLEPEAGDVHLWWAMLLTATGRHDEAVARIERGLEVAPDSAIVNVKAVTILTAAGLFERAETQVGAALERSPGMALAHRELGFLELERDEPAAAIAPLERAAELSGGKGKSTGGLGYALALVGRDEEARAVLEAMRARAESEYVPPMNLALVEIGLGEIDAAFAELDLAYEQRDPGLVYLTTKPGYDRLADDPRFGALVERVGLPWSGPGS